MNNSRTGENPSIMVHSALMPSRRRERQRRHAPSMKSLPSLMEFLGKESQKYPSSPKSINSVSIRPGMKCGMSYPYHTLAIKKRSGIFFYINLDPLWDT